MPFLFNNTPKRLSIRLADDTMVTLAPNSGMQVTDAQANSESIARMKQRGFVVHTKEINKPKKVIEKKGKPVTDKAPAPAPKADAAMEKKPKK